MVLIAGIDEFEVTDSDGRYVVDLRKHTCTYRVWDCSGLPCKHAAACVRYKRERLEKYYDPYYSVAKYMTVYKDIIHAMPGLDELKEEHMMRIVQPPPLKMLVGKLTKCRRKDPDEEPSGQFRRRSHTIRCTRCKSTDHNVRRCKGAPGKDKAASSGKTVGTKRKERSMGSQSTINNSQMLTRSQASSTTTEVNIQLKTKAQLKLKEEKRKAQKARKKARKEGSTSGAH
ncbi:uncharacterized protein LOC122078602 [Macadamia integrifolia]|uniref:uncharacterized protein LOC122078602 n=1 Tax=Macadamia integrifolia TaxID=60698 RepID=UPI001C4E40C8|nr:uncharacterized protein LOC122078602 [Macadamia integrifolia]